MSEELIRRSDAIKVAKEFWYKPDIAGALAELPTIEPKTKVVAQVTFDEEKLREIVKEAVERFKEEYEIADRPQGEWVATDDTDEWYGLTYKCNICGSEATQTETQNSNLTFKTLEYCDICDHKGCEECIANALDEHCMPSQFKKQIEDECAKEYEELGLKELKELIEADRKTEPSSSEIPNNCETCKHYKLTCDLFSEICKYEPKDEPTISKMEQVDKDINVRSKDEPQTERSSE